MCGRYAFDDPKEIFEFRMILEDIADIFGTQATSSLKIGEIFPTETVAVVAQNDNQNQPQPMTWGYPLSGLSRPLINARQETLTEKPMFRGSLKHQKVLIPCTGFFEWKNENKQKIKHKIQLKSSDYFYLGGLYKTFLINNQPTSRFVIITMPANSHMQTIHQRMPLMIHPHDKTSWLVKSSEMLPKLLTASYNHSLIIEKTD